MCSDHRNLKNHPVASSVLEDDRAQSQNCTILDPLYFFTFFFFLFFFFLHLVLFLFVCLDVLIYRLVVTVHSMDSEPRDAGFFFQQPAPCAAMPRDATPRLFPIHPWGAAFPRAVESTDPPADQHPWPSVLFFKGEAVPCCLTASPWPRLLPAPCGWHWDTVPAWGWLQGMWPWSLQTPTEGGDCYQIFPREAGRKELHCAPVPKAGERGAWLGL